MKRSIVVTAVAGVGVGVLVGSGLGVTVLGGDDGEAGPDDRVEEACDRATAAVESEQAPGGDADLLVFLERETTEAQRMDLESSLISDERVAEVDYVDQAETRAEFERLFEGSAEMLARVEANADLLPTSFRVTVLDHDRDAAEALEAELVDQPGVMRATSAPTWDESTVGRTCEQLAD